MNNHLVYWQLSRIRYYLTIFAGEFVKSPPLMANVVKASIVVGLRELLTASCANSDGFLCNDHTLTALCVRLCVTFKKKIRIFFRIFRDPLGSKKFFYKNRKF